MTRAITGSKRTLAALREAERKLRNIIEHSSNLFYLHTADHVLTYVSPQSRQFFDCEPDEALVRWTEFLSDHPANQIAIEATQRAIDTGQRQPPYEIECVGRQGRKIWVQVHETPIVENGETVAVVGSLVDITERKRAEEEIARLNAALAARAAELEITNRELEAFNYTVAHDLRKPLTAISGFSQVIQELCGSRLDEQCRNCLQEILEGTWRMNRLIDALLDFSHLAHVEPKKERVDLSALAQQIATELQMHDPDRRVTFRIADDVMVEGDACLLRVVLNNLLGNAWKYTGSQESGIIEFGTMVAGGTSACYVRDNGRGFDMADASKLFVPFQRLCGAEDCAGFGVGLATVERIVRRHGGRVWATGERGRGATFFFTLEGG